MEEELKELAESYAILAANLTAKWPNGIEKLNGKDYRGAVSDLATASAFEIAARDINRIIDIHTDDGK